MMKWNSLLFSTLALLSGSRFIGQTYQKSCPLSKKAIPLAGDDF
jgi:hypothetical protein